MIIPISPIIPISQKISENKSKDISINLRYLEISLEISHHI